MYKLSYSNEAKEDLRKLPKYISKRIGDKLIFYSHQKNIFNFAKPLYGVGEKRYRFRVGDYRILFTIEPDGIIVVLVILAIGHRKDIYFE